MIRFDPIICTDFEAATSREWLETNGIGGFASGTISGANSRRYHGLLTAATKPPLGRFKMVSKVEETIRINGKTYELSTNRYPGSVYPKGFEQLTSFRLDPFPVWTYLLGDVEVEKRVFMVHGRNSTVLQYKAKQKKRSGRCEISMAARPLLSFVDYHHLRSEGDDLDGSFVVQEGRISMRPSPDLPRIFFDHNGVSVERTGHWYRNFEYAIEQERGFDFHEDLFQPFELLYDLESPVHMIISASEPIDVGPAELARSEIQRRRKLVEQAKAKTEIERTLVLAADQFVVRRGEGHTIIAGYPWFSDWGRDTMIALPGLTLVTGRPEVARDILLEFSRSVSQGMLPNRFPDAGDEADYNTVDATLWYFEAVRAYAESTGDLAFVRENIYKTLTEILVWHVRATRFNIHVDTDGLLFAGEPGVQLTWMDAKIGDKVITPRTGKPVEIQALWYNALRVMSSFAGQFGDSEDKERYEAMADLAKLSFNAAFWNEDERCLYDVIENGTRDGSVRPNQIFAVSLRYSILDGERARAVVDKVEAELLTPFGLRSLSPNDPNYAPIYIGSPLERDAAYHQGTVWAWLIGPFIDAFRKVYPDKKDRAAELVSGLERHLTEAGVGQISEIFDADAPHRPRGCPAQAWSVGELLRVLR